MRPALRILQYLLLVCSMVLLGYCAFAAIDSRMFQAKERARLESLLHANTAAPPVAANGLIGRIEIPRLDVSVMVVEGSSDAVLRRAAGHIEGTASPGRPGNTAISAHRDTFFRPLRHIRQDDVINVTTLQGNYNYRVISTRIVSPEDVSVLKPGSAESLTLVTCYPFYFVGAAPQRFIVRAERVL